MAGIKIALAKCWSEIQGLEIIAPIICLWFTYLREKINVNFVAFKLCIVKNKVIATLVIKSKYQLFTTQYFLTNLQSVCDILAASFQVSAIKIIYATNIDSAETFCWIFFGEIDMA